ncbi:MAG: hypothetical protein L3J53_06475 [Proteobacteria bacterium]|nr:hypothetical protein [Pseudomonadota bacterium]
MRTAAGVILIIAAVLNLMASLGYLAGGGAATVLGSGMSEIAIMAEQEGGNQMTAEQKAAIEKVQEKVGGSGIGLMAFGVFLLVSVGILIAGAVFLFKNTKPQFIMIAGGMAILAEVIGSLISSFGVMNILGLVGGILAIIAAKGMGAGSVPEPEPEP